MLFKKQVFVLPNGCPQREASSQPIKSPGRQFQSLKFPQEGTEQGNGRCPRQSSDALQCQHYSSYKKYKHHLRFSTFFNMLFSTHSSNNLDYETSLQALLVLSNHTQVLLVANSESVSHVLISSWGLFLSLGCYIRLPSAHWGPVVLAAVKQTT